MEAFGQTNRRGQGTPACTTRAERAKVNLLEGLFRRVGETANWPGDFSKYQRSFWVRCFFSKQATTCF